MLTALFPEYHLFFPSNTTKHNTTYTKHLRIKMTFPITGAPHREENFRHLPPAEETSREDSTSQNPEPETVTDPNAWKSKLRVRAFEAEDVRFDELTPPPYPFEQSWDSRSQSMRERENILGRSIGDRTRGGWTHRAVSTLSDRTAGANHPAFQRVSWRSDPPTGRGGRDTEAERTTSRNIRGNLQRSSAQGNPRGNNLPRNPRGSSLPWNLRSNGPQGNSRGGHSRGRSHENSWRNT